MSNTSTVARVNSYDEWTQLREVIVGHASGFTGFHLDNSFNLFYWDNVKQFLASKRYFRDESDGYQWPTIAIEKQVIDELQEDIEGFISTLTDLGVTVRRPATLVGDDRFKTPYWESIQSPPLNVRDQTIVLGTAIVETSPHVRARLFENDYLKPLFYEYMQSGARWISMPRPTLAAGTFDSSFFSLQPEEVAALRDYHALPVPELGFEMIFDGAQCMRIGKDILVNVANTNHLFGYHWLVSNFGDTFNFHMLDRISDSHIDSIILPLRPGLWLVRDRKFLDYLPTEFSGWDFIVAPEAEQDLFPSYERHNLSISSKFIDMNVLSVNEDTVIVNSLYPELVRCLEARHFTVAQVRHRHRRLFGGGFHCFTLDVSRTGGLESYAY